MDSRSRHSSAARESSSTDSNHAELTAPLSKIQISGGSEFPTDYAIRHGTVDNKSKVIEEDAASSNSKAIGGAAIAELRRNSLRAPSDIRSSVAENDDPSPLRGRYFGGVQRPTHAASSSRRTVISRESESGTATSLTEKKAIDFLFLVVHGIASTREMLDRAKEDFKASLRSMIRYWFWEIEVTIHVEFIDWKTPLLARQREIFGRSSVGSNAARYEGSIVSPHEFITSALADLMCFMTPDHGDYILQMVATSLNDRVEGLRARPHRRFADSRIILVGHSLGGVILHELLTGHKARSLGSSAILPTTTFTVDALFLLGCPLGAFLSLHHLDTLPLPPKIKVYNVYHKLDPLACRLEPLYYQKVDVVPAAVRLPYWKNNGCHAYLRWDRNVETTRKTVTDYVSKVASAAASTLKNMFQRKSEEENESVDDVVAPEKSQNRSSQKSSLLLKDGEDPKQPASLGSVSSSTKTRIVPPTQSPRFALKISANARYGAHDRKPISGYRKDEGGSTWSFGGARSPPLKAATLQRLMAVLKIEGDAHEKELKIQLETGQADIVEVAGTGRRLGDHEIDEVLSEYETGTGLELPVRLDFELQENLAEHYVSHIGSLSHFNYWNSRDAALFVVKQITQFRPRIAYPDFRRIVDYSEKLSVQKSPAAPNTQPENPKPRRAGLSSGAPLERNLVTMREQAEAFFR